MLLKGTFDFQELTPRGPYGKPITGMMLYGTAELESSYPNWPGQLYVASVTIEGAATITLAKANAQPSSFDGVLFKAIANELENDKTELGRLAQSEFTEAVEAGEPEISFRQRMARELERA